MNDADFRDLMTDGIPRLRRLAVRVAPAGYDPDDLVQDTLERAWKGRHQFRHEAAVATWLHRILVNRAQDLSERAGAVPVDLMEIDDRVLFGVEVEDPAMVVERAHDVAQLRSALSSLSAVDRSILALHDAEGWPVRMIAQACGLEPAAAHKRLQRGRFRLVQALTGAPMPTGPADEGCLHARSLAGDYLDGALGEGDRAVVETHLSNCVHCPPLAQALVGLRTSMETGTTVTSLHADIGRFLHVLRSEA